MSRRNDVHGTSVKIRNSLDGQFKSQLSLHSVDCEDEGRRFPV
jgi:hypothetical protein